MKTFEQLLSDCVTRADDSSFEALTTFAANKQFSISQIASLTSALANSGSQLDLSAHTKTADIASTGGPSSLSTILCPLYLRCLGCVVPSLGVPGRPAGAVDVLGQIPNFKVHLPLESVSCILNTSGYVHVTADSELAPLDASLFDYRRRMKVQPIPALAVASLLSKKLALGVRDVGLDIRIGPYGNFGTSFADARNNALLFCQTAQILGMRAMCFLTDGTIPYQPYIGRSESLLALRDLFAESATDWLMEHNKMCLHMAQSLTNNRHTPELSVARDAFIKNLDAQGASFSSFIDVCHRADSALRYPIHANCSGFLCVDMGLLRTTIGRLQSIGETQSKYPDSCGLILAKKHDEYVNSGEIVAHVRCPTAQREDFLPAIAAAFRLVEAPLCRTPFESVSLDQDVKGMAGYV